MLNADFSSAVEVLAPLIKRICTKEKLPDDWNKEMLINVLKKGDLALANAVIGEVSLCSRNRRRFSARLSCTSYRGPSNRLRHVKVDKYMVSTLRHWCPTEDHQLTESHL
ncbi:unnamed protein product [Arctia plantaginis]|uniref:Uncharacterized protein n=1 Tax=Arctia plantaginis TaxID=874455 RepID=A0A8S0ZRA4_ARCPL|nr:unnamed protein product [Arctia plantaginis]